MSRSATSMFVANVRGTAPRTWDSWAKLAVAAGIVLRCWWTLVRHVPLDHIDGSTDIQAYVGRAVDLVTGQPLGPLDALLPPGTHLLLAGPLFLFGANRSGLWADAMLW